METAGVTRNGRVKTQALPLADTPSRAADFLSLAKPRLNTLVVLTAGVGYLLGASADFSFLTLLHTVVGSALVAGGAAALNQVAERDLDQAMERTRRRPMPTGRIQSGEAVIFALLITTCGVVQLALGTNTIATLVALATLVSYIGIYTPLKRRTPWATLVGAVPGALPAVIGWSAAQGVIGVEGWSLFGIVFLWQLPHFYALAWMYRDDFRRAELPLLAVIDPTGRRNARHALAYAMALVPVSLLPSVIGLTGRSYAGAATGLGVAFVFLALRFSGRPSPERARALFFGSLVYLPLLWAVLVADRVF